MLLCLDLLQSRLKTMEIFPLSPLGFEPNCTALNAWDTRQKDGQKNRRVPTGIPYKCTSSSSWHPGGHRHGCWQGSLCRRKYQRHSQGSIKAHSQPTLHPSTGRNAQLCKVGSGHDGWDGGPIASPTAWPGTGSTHGSGRRERSWHRQCWLPRDVSSAQCLSSRLFIFTGKNRK